jgi:predicted acetyltransferase
VDIRLVGDGDLDALFDLRDLAFGPSPASLEMRARFTRAAIGQSRVLGCYEGGRLIAIGRFFDVRQWWHGGAVPMAGVASVYVAPERRGSGVGRRLMTALLELIAERGYALSVLYPATVPVYRSVGYEHAGAQHVITLRAEALRGLAAGRPPVPVRRLGTREAPEAVRTVSRLNQASGACGLVDWSEGDAAEAFNDPGLFGYLAADGYLEYGWSGDNSELHVHQLVAGSEATLRTLGALVGSGSSVAETVRACLAPNDPLLWLLRDRTAEDVRRVPWMLRLVDVPAAMERRGFPAGVNAEATLSVDDPQLSGNAGTWRLTVGGGHGRMVRAGDSETALRLSAGGLAALYAGVPLSTLRRAGLVTGSGASLDASLDAAFAATPYMLDYF